MTIRDIFSGIIDTPISQILFSGIFLMISVILLILIADFINTKLMSFKKLNTDKIGFGSFILGLIIVTVFISFLTIFNLLFLWLFNISLF